MLGVLRGSAPGPIQHSGVQQLYSALLAAELDPRAWEAATSAANVLDRVAEIRAEIAVDPNFDPPWEGPAPDLVRLAQEACKPPPSSCPRLALMVVPRPLDALKQLDRLGRRRDPIPRPRRLAQVEGVLDRRRVAPGRRRWTFSRTTVTYAVARCLQKRENPAICGAFQSTATGIRTRVSAVRGRYPSPLDDGGSEGAAAGHCTRRPSGRRAVAGGGSPRGTPERPARLSGLATG